MKIKWILNFLFVFAFILLVSGCKDNGPAEPTEADKNKEAMKEIIVNDAFFTIDNSVMNDGDVSTTPSNSFSKISADIIPFFWGRKIESATRNITFTVITDSTASAIVTHSWTGIVWIKGKQSLSDTTLSLFTKNVTESTTRNVKFIRINRDKDVRKNWKISEISVMQGGTSNGGITFTKVVFYIGTDTLEITNPLDYYFQVEKRIGHNGLHSVSQNAVPNFKIRVELLSADSIRDYVVAHRPVWDQTNRVYRRGLFVLVDSSRQGDLYKRTYEHSWRGAWSGRHHVFVGAVTHRSLFDDTAPFASQIWGIPFLVEP